jgi:large subunit ribosomal protein L25
LSELKLPAGVSIPELRLGKEHDLAVAIAKEIKEEVEAAPAAEAAAATPAAGAAAPAAGAKAAPAAAAKAAPAKDEKKK